MKHKLYQTTWVDAEDMGRAIKALQRFGTFPSTLSGAISACVSAVGSTLPAGVEVNVEEEIRKLKPNVELIEMKRIR